MSETTTKKPRNGAAKAEAATGQPPVVPGIPVGTAGYEAATADLLKFATVEEADLPAERPELKLNEKDIDTFRAWAEAKYITKATGEALDGKQDALEVLLFAKWIETLWMSKARPKNPELRIAPNGVLEVETIFVVKDDYAVKMPRRGGMTARDNLTKTLAEVITKTGTNEDDAKEIAGRIAAACVEQVQVPHLRDFGDFETPEQKIAHFKLVKLMAWDGSDPAPAPLTGQDKALLLSAKMTMAVLPGFAERVLPLVQSREQLTAVFGVIVPKTVVNAPEFGATFKTGDRFDKLGKVAQDAVTSYARKNGDEDE